MSLIVGDREHWYRVQRESDVRPIFVRPAVRELSIDDSPFADLLNRVSDEIERRVQSHRERLQSPYRRWLDYRLVRMAYRAQKAGKLRLPRIYWRHVGRRMLARFNRQIDRWLFHPEGNPAIDRIACALCAFTALYLIAQLVRAWR